MWQQQLLDTFEHAERRLLLLDYDGTLTPIVSRPEEAAPSSTVLELLEALATHPGVDVVVISGRRREDLEGWFSNLPLHFIAEHGFCYRGPQTQSWRSLADHDEQPHTVDIPAVRDILNTFVGKHPGCTLEAKISSIALHYRNAEQHAHVATTAIPELLHELAALIHTVRIIHGDEVVEVAPKGFDKGQAAQWFIQQQGINYDFVLAAGDDTTDEDMLAVVQQRSAQQDGPSSWAIKVGEKPSVAPYRITDVAGFIHLLKRLATPRTTLTR